MRYHLTALLAVLTVTLAGLAVVQTAAASSGISLAQASAQIEFNVRLVVPSIVTKAQEQLRLANQIGGPNGIAQAQENLKLAKAGLEVDHASCLGTKPARGGHSTFRCKLSLSDDLGFTGKALGTYGRATSGSWRWQTSSFTLAGYGPAEWHDVIR